MAPLIINPIYTLYSGYLLCIFPLVSLPLQNWWLGEDPFLFGFRPIFRGHVNLRECTCIGWPNCYWVGTILDKMWNSKRKLQRKLWACLDILSLLLLSNQLYLAHRGSLVQTKELSALQAFGLFVTPLLTRVHRTIQSQPMHSWMREPTALRLSVHASVSPELPKVLLKYLEDFRWPVIQVHHAFQLVA